LSWRVPTDPMAHAVGFTVPFTLQAAADHVVE
jgi:hypothetical protein